MQHLVLICHVTILLTAKFEYFEMQIKCKNFDIWKMSFTEERKSQFWNEQINNNGQFCVKCSFKLLI